MRRGILLFGSMAGFLDSWLFRQAAGAYASSINTFAPAATSVSAGGHATCETGPFAVTASANHIKLLYDGPTNQLQMTQTYVELHKTSPTIYDTANGGNNSIHGTWDIYVQFCLPADPSAARKAETAQILTHGNFLDSTYFDFGRGISYVDAAAKAGYATLAYDRLGVGGSDHPDPVQVVQADLHVEIAHVLVKALRSGAFGDRKFKSVVGVGHSAGSAYTQALSNRYPADLDAVIVSGISVSGASVGEAATAQTPIIANLMPRDEFKKLPNGYLTAGTQQGLQFGFFTYPHFKPEVLERQFRKLQTDTVGEMFTLRNVGGQAIDYTKPVLILNGKEDLVFCGGNCTTDIMQSALDYYYPNAGLQSQIAIVPKAGHNVFQHTTAHDAFSSCFAFLKSYNL